MSERLSEAQKRERKVLTEMSSGEYFHFRALSSFTGLSRRDVRLICRRLKRKGLAEFGKGLWTDDGDPYGSGYKITPAGRAALSDIAALSTKGGG
jgi:hypothetical protein